MMSLFDIWLFATFEADRHLFDSTYPNDPTWYKVSFDQFAALIEEAMFLPNQKNPPSKATWEAYWRFTEKHWEET